MSKTYRSRPSDDEWNSGPRKGFTGARKRRDAHRPRHADERRWAGAGRLPDWLLEQSEADDDVIEYGRSPGLFGITR